MRLFPALFPALNRPMKAWHGKTVWIVGASSGIGEATAAALHAVGARVIVSARQAQTLGALPQSLAYGPTKAALINLAETLYQDLRPRGIGVSLINPGFVQIPLTAGNDFSMPAVLTPAQAAAAIVQGWARGAFEIHFPKRFTLWMQTLRFLPDRVFFFLVQRVTQ